MRICIVVPYDLAEQGGVKRHAFQLAAALRGLGDDVTVMGASSTPAEEPSVHVFGGIVNIRSNGSDNRLAILTPPWKIRRWLDEQAFDVIHVHEPLCPLLAPWAALFAGSATLVGTFHAFAEKEERGPKFMRWWSAPLILPRFARAIAVSEPAAAYARFVWKRELAIIPNGIAMDIFRPTSPRPHGGKLRLLFVGHWRDGRKGLPVLLEAVSLLHDRGVPVSLDVVGSGPAGVAPPELPGVTFHGPAAGASEIATYLNECDVFVAPSLGQESFGIVLLEAMASGRAIACSDIAGYREVVSAENARIVAPGSAVALAAAIADLAQDPEERSAMAQRNVHRAEQFAWSTLVHRVRAEYQAAS